MVRSFVDVFGLIYRSGKVFHPVRVIMMMGLVDDGGGRRFKGLQLTVSRGDDDDCDDGKVRWR